MTKPCVYPGCDQPRMLDSKGRSLTMCEAHVREYGRRKYRGNWDGWLGKRHGKRKASAPRTSKRTQRVPSEPAPLAASAPAIRIIALRCASCAIKYPYTDEHFDVGAQSRTCRHCAEAQIVTIVNPLDNTARHARLLIGGEQFSCGEGAEAYAAFARAERRDGRMVVIAW